MSFANVDGVRLEVKTIAGPAGRPWLVFLHEGLGCIELWREFPETLARRVGMPALVYSRRGYGRSDPLDGPRNLRFMHDEALVTLPKLLAQYGIARRILIGHSDGASMALIHAASAVDQVLGVVLMAPHVMVEPISIESIARVTATYETSGLRSRLARYHVNVDDAFRGWSDIWLDSHFRHWTLLEEARALKCPTLLVQGRDDEYGTMAQLDTIQGASTALMSRLVLDDCGHSPHRDHQNVVTEAIAAFISSLNER